MAGKVTIEDVRKAKERIGKHVYQTPLEFSKQLSTDETKVYMKLECQQRLKAFKIRGALNKLLSLTPDERKRGVIASSSGNHGCGLSYASQIVGMENVDVYVPKTTPDSKKETIRFYGANVIEVGENYDEAHHAADEALARENKVYVDSSGDVEVIAGQGTIGLEIIAQNPTIDTIVVPIGGGGIITGIAVAAKHHNPSIKIVGVQTEACPAFLHSLRDNKCYLEYPTEDSICDALVGGILEIPFEMAKECIDDILLVKEDSIRDAIKLLLTKEKIVAEPAGAASVAALLDHPDYFIGRNVAVVITGGNISDAVLMDALHR